jgi:hypothetical protein
MNSHWEHDPEPPGSGQDVSAAGFARHAGVSEALAATEDLASVPVAEHVARFEAVHSALSDALSTIDKG